MTNKVKRVFLKTVGENSQNDNVEELDVETIVMTDRMVVIRVATKHINIWIRQLDMKKKEIIELAG